MSRGVVVEKATGAAAISVTYVCRDVADIEKITISFDVAPTTSEEITVTLDANAGAAYDTVLRSFDPSSLASTSIEFSNLGRLVAGDQVVVAYTNTDTKTYGVQIYADRSAFD